MSTAPATVFNRLTEQPRVRTFLTTAAQEHRLSHAYLFVGAPGSGKLDAARAVAQSLVCPQGGDGSCDECIRVMHGSHPDVHIYKPESTTGYLLSQIQALIADTALAPVRAKVKVYILQEAGLLRGTSANALLKTIEEPPQGVYFILIARTISSVLPTLVSRCQQVPFRIVSPDSAQKAVEQACGASAWEARVALAVASTPERAVSFLRSSDRREVRRTVVRILGELERDDSWDIVCAAREIMESVDKPFQSKFKKKASKKKGSKAKADSQADLNTDASDLEGCDENGAPYNQKEFEKYARELYGDYLGATDMKRLLDARKREVTALERSVIIEALAAADCLLRDALLRCEGIPEPIVNEDAADIVDRIAAATCGEGVVRACTAVAQAADNISHNVTPRLAFEVMLFAIKEALACPPISR